MRRHLAPLLASLALASAAHAQSLNIVNAGFEASPIAAGAFTIGLPSGWTAYDPTGRLNGTNDSLGLIHPMLGQDVFPAGAPEGQQSALVFLARVLPGEAGLQQTLGDTLQANTLYTLSVAVGNIASGTSLPGSSDGGNVFYNLNGFPGYRIELRAGNNLLAQDNNSLGALIPEGQFMTSTLVVNSSAFAGLVGQALSIRLINLDLPGTAQAPGIEVDFDRVQLLASPVPEPDTSVLALLGVVAIAARRRWHMSNAGWIRGWISCRRDGAGAV